MAGGSLHLSLSVGPSSSTSSSTSNPSTSSQRFLYQSVYNAISTFLFIHKHLSVSVEADMQVWGPDSFGGLAQVDFWFYSFKIGFGDSTKSIPGISLQEFYEMVRTPGLASTPPTTDATATTNPTSPNTNTALRAVYSHQLPPAQLPTSLTLVQQQNG